MEKLLENLTPPITFRLYQSIRFNRPVNKEEDYISPGGYELKMKDKDGVEKSVQFDFEDYYGTIDDEDPCVVHCIQENPDFDTFDGLTEVTGAMFMNITEVVEWFIYTEELGDNKSPLIPTEVFEPVIEIINDASRKDIPVSNISITVPITPSSNV